MAAKTTFSQTIPLEAASSLDALRMAQALTTIGKHIDLENLEMLAKKVTKPDVNKKIKQYSAFF